MGMTVAKVLVYFGVAYSDSLLASCTTGGTGDCRVFI
jgi:hypothetical protein